jgi:hypothetical protein
MILYAVHVPLTAAQLFHIFNDSDAVPSSGAAPEGAARYYATQQQHCPTQWRRRVPITILGCNKGSISICKFKIIRSIDCQNLYLDCTHDPLCLSAKLQWIVACKTRHRRARGLGSLAGTGRRRRFGSHCFFQSFHSNCLRLS